MTKEELAEKVDWEGGVAEAITGYGLDDSYLPDDAPGYVRANWKIVHESGKSIERIEEWLHGGTE